MDDLLVTANIRLYLFKLMECKNKWAKYTILSGAEMSMTSRHSFKVSETKFKGAECSRFFTQVMLGVWNALPVVVIEADTTVAFMGKMVNMNVVD